MADPASIYDQDFFAWTQDQATALRNLSPAIAGNTLDIAHLAEEIEDLGKRDLREVQSLLRRLIEHMIKMAALPNSVDRPHWAQESRMFQVDARAAFKPAMTQMIEINMIWRQGQKLAHAALADIGQDIPVLKSCPFTQDELLAEEFDINQAVGNLILAWQTGN